MPGNGTYMSLGEIARSGLLRWKDIATIRKYVDGYPKIFRPTILNADSKHSKKFLIARKNVVRFQELWTAGKLKEFHKVNYQRKVEQSKFVSIVCTPFREKTAGRLRHEIEKEGFGTSLVRVKTRLDFMHILYGQTETYSTVIFVLDAEERALVFPSGEEVSSTRIRQIGDNKGIQGKTVIMLVDEKLPRFPKAFIEKGHVASYAEAYTPKEALHHVSVANRKGKTCGKISELIKEPAYAKHRK